MRLDRKPYGSVIRTSVCRQGARYARWLPSASSAQSLFLTTRPLGACLTRSMPLYSYTLSCAAGSTSYDGVRASSAVSASYSSLLSVRAGIASAGANLVSIDTLACYSTVEYS